MSATDIAIALPAITSERAKEAADSGDWPMRWEIAFLAVFTIVYGIAVAGGAVLRPLWIDEIATLRLATLPALHDLWAALSAGADSAPPGLYLLTRISTALAGSGPLPVRLPAMAGYWSMSVGVFYFVKRWAGSTLAAFTVLFIGATMAVNYATEARGYGPLLGALGLSMLCWQRVAQGKNRRVWLAGLAVSTGLAASFHYYTPVIYLPLLIAELVRTVRLRRIEWSVWAALMAGMGILIVYLPFLRGMAHVSLQLSRMPHYWAAATGPGLVQVYEELFSSMAAPVTLAAVVLAMGSRSIAPNGSGRRRELPEYAALAFGLVMLPWILFVVCRIVHGALASHYLLPTLIGVALLAVILVRRLPGVRFTAPSLTILFALMFLVRLWHSQTRTIPEVNAIRHIIDSTTAERLPVVIAVANHFLPFVQNPPGDIQRRAYYLVSPESAYDAADPTAERALLVLQPWAHWQHVLDVDDFLSKHREFLVYSPRDVRFNLIVPELLRRGVSLQLISSGVLRATAPPASR